MKNFILFLAFTIQIFAAGANDIQGWFNKGEFKKVCSTQIENLLKDSNNEELISLFGMSCLKIHDINRLALPISKLVKSKNARENAAYFADVLLKKKLLYYAIIDEIDISYVRLPRSDYILSFIFDKFVKKQYIQDIDIYIFQEPNSDTRYELGVSQEKDMSKLVLKIFKNDNLTSQIEYR
ncbi:MAG: hypothetical protein LUC34_07295 [Campylobacter sp.]|nr:hypothetical protein [Campylobacter sp.]